MGYCFHPMAHGNEVSGFGEISQFPTPTISTDFGNGHGIIKNDQSLSGIGPRTFQIRPKVTQKLTNPKYGKFKTSDQS